MMLEAVEDTLEGRGEGECDEGYGDGGEGGPEDECVPLP